MTTTDQPTSPSPAGPSDLTKKGTVYVVVQGRWPGSDVSGVLLLDSGEALWSHMSSSLSWLRRDLTDGFGDRRLQLAERYPDGYDVVVVDVGDEIPADVLARNEVWRAAEDAEAGEQRD